MIAELCCTLPQDAGIMERRRLLQWLAVGGFGTTLGLGTIGLERSLAEEGKHWGYIGATGPEAWGKLAPEYQACQAGTQQSPIALEQAIKADLAEFALNYQSIPLTILNNGHTVQVNAIAGNTLTLDGEVFELKQFHLHHPSEHTLNGKPFPMEAHFVHANAKQELAVVGVFLQAGAANPVWQTVLSAMPPQPTPAKTIGKTQIDLKQLLPSDRAFFRYFGSLTTPPCSEIVRWVVMETPVTLSQSQIQQFSALFPLNARPVQAMNRRFLLRSR